MDPPVIFFNITPLILLKVKSLKKHSKLLICPASNQRLLCNETVHLRCIISPTKGFVRFWSRRKTPPYGEIL